jgi:hypothetical protein
MGECMQNYQVGQILFLIGDSNKVIPIQVVEEVIRTTLDGKEKTYIIKLPDKKETTIDIKKIKGELFTDKKELQTFMLQNANNAIKQMLNEAEEVALTLFGHDQTIDDISEEELLEDNPVVIEPALITEKVQPEKENDIIKVDLGNGKFGKMTVGDLNNAGAPQ